MAEMTPQALSPVDLFDNTAELSGTPAQNQPEPRRSFLSRAATALAVVPALAIASTPRRGGAKTPPKPSLPNLYPGWNAKNFQEIQTDENEHVQFIISSITQLGGTPRPEPIFQNLLASNILDFAVKSYAFENTGVGAYQAAAPLISNPAILTAAAKIAFVEALHAGYINTLLNQPIVVVGLSFSLPLPIPVIVQRASPFIASLNGGPDPSTEISTTPSPQNDIAILNFALLLEYLERDFYNINVPYFFG